MLLAILTTTTLAIGIRILVNPLSNVFQKYLTQRQANPLFIISSTYGILSLVCLVYLLLFPPAPLPLSFWYNSVIFNGLGVAGNYFLVKSLQRGDLSVLGPVNAYKALVSLVFGLFLLGEIPNSWGIAGMLLIVLGSYFVLSHTSDSQRFSWSVFISISAVPYSRAYFSETNGGGSFPFFLIKTKGTSSATAMAIPKR